MRAVMAPRDLADLTTGRAGDYRVDLPMICVLTRFRVRSPIHLLLSYLDYRRVARDASPTPGLLRTAFLVEDLRTWYSLSIWRDRDCIPEFGTRVLRHIFAAHRVFGRFSMDERQRPELWSAKWRIESVSNNLSWDDFDLKDMITRASAAADATADEA
jgi:hypothetical protein